MDIEIVQPTIVHFYKTSEKPFGVFSNFAKYPIVINHRTYHTTEHFFQSQKFVGTHHELDVMNTPTPSLAAAMGRDRKRPLRGDWENVKDEVMRRAVLEKFKQHVDLSDILLATGDAILVEHTSKDKYWGDGGDGSGKNMLGKILMEVRDIIRNNVSK